MLKLLYVGIICTLYILFKLYFFGYLEFAKSLKLFHQRLISVMYDDRLYNSLLLVFSENFFHFHVGGNTEGSGIIFLILTSSYFSRDNMLFMYKPCSFIGSSYY